MSKIMPVIGFCSLFFALSPGAHAALVVDATYKNMTYGTETFNAILNNKSSSVSAGMLSFTKNQVTGVMPLPIGSTFSAFCVEVLQNVVTGKKVSYSFVDASTRFSAAKTDAITRLYTLFNGQVNSKSTSAAFQLALWEIVDDFDENSSWTSLNLSNGKFKLSWMDTYKNTVKLAQHWLGQLSGTKSKYDMYVMTNQFSQDQLVFGGTDKKIDIPNPPSDITDVSSPAMVGIFGMSLLAFGAWRRRFRHA